MGSCYGKQDRRRTWLFLGAFMTVALGLTVSDAQQASPINAVLLREGVPADLREQGQVQTEGLNNARISGFVVDQNHAAVGRATVRLEDTSGITISKTVSGAKGEFGL